jgi:hypothetical protein
MLHAKRHAHRLPRTPHACILTDSAGTVVDTAGALCIVDSYIWLQPHWRRVQQLEQCVFAIVLLALGHSSRYVRTSHTYQH